MDKLVTVVVTAFCVADAALVTVVLVSTYRAYYARQIMRRQLWAAVGLVLALLVLPVVVLVALIGSVFSGGAPGAPSPR